MIRILVVDDELVSRKKMAKILNALGKVKEAETGNGAIKAFSDAIDAGEPFDLVSLDVGLPDLNGTDLLVELRDLEAKVVTPGYKPVKILMVTAHSDRDTVLTSIQAGCDEYVVKPFTSDLVMRKLRQIGFLSKEGDRSKGSKPNVNPLLDPKNNPWS
ncbi:MAG: response regulator [bacterium]|nr:response regulator [bacterium]